MTERDWQRIVLGLKEWFPAGEKWAGSDGPEAYRLHLDTVHEQDAGDVFNAVVALSREQKFRPSPGEIMERIHGKPGVVFASPERAWSLVVTAIGMVSGGVTDPGFGERHQKAIDWLRSQDEAVAAWAARRGLRGRGSLGMEEVHHPQFGGAVVKRLGDEYGGMRDRAVQRLQLGKPAFEARAFLVRGSGGGLSIAEWGEKAGRELQSVPVLNSGEVAA